MIGAFLSCSNKAHDVAFIRQPVKGKFHHASFELGSWEKVLRAGRHPVPHQDLHRHRPDPSRHHPRRDDLTLRPVGQTATKVFAGGYIYYPDKPPITWWDVELGPAIFYHDRKLNEAFLSVF